MIHLVVPIGVSHISLWLKEIQPREWEKKNKEQTNNKGLGQLKCKKGGSVTLHFLCICRLMLMCILCEISTKPWGMLTHLDWSSLTTPGLYLMLTGLFCCPVLTALLHHPSPTASLSSFFQLLSDRHSLANFQSCQDLELRPLFGFAPKQTKRLSAWCTPFIVSQLSSTLVTTLHVLFYIKTCANINILITSYYIIINNGLKSIRQIFSSCFPHTRERSFQN